MRVLCIMSRPKLIKAISYCLCTLLMATVCENRCTSTAEEKPDQIDTLISNLEYTGKENINDTFDEQIPNEEYELIEAGEKESAILPLDEGTIEQQEEAMPEQEDDSEQEDIPQQPEKMRRINDIILIGNKHVPDEAILYRIPYKVGELFNPQKTRTLIKRLYYDLKRFRNITLKGEPIGEDLMNLYIIVDEKKPLKDVIIKRNKQLSEKEIKTKINFEEVPAIDKEELKRYARAIKKLYIDKGYHRVEVDTELTIDDDDTAIAIFSIREHAPSIVKRIDFTGNTHVSGKKLRGLLLTKEDWILSLMDKSGNYHPERLEADKYMIEQYYQSNGYMYAKVIDVVPHTDPCTGNIHLIFDIQEGDLYTISDIKVTGNDILTEECLLASLPIKPGDIYSRERINNAIRILEMIWGNLGYAYAHIEPSIQPNDETKTVSIAFFSEPGKRVFLNKLNIIGNKKTRDKVIRRNIMLEEGALITNMGMEASKNRTESLGYFEQKDGVNWKMTRISEELADLDLVVQEAKTGSANIKIGYGGSGIDIKSPASGFSAELNVADRNLFGSGIMFNLTGRFSKDEKTVNFSLTQPWLFDRPIFGKIDMYHRRVSWDELRYTRPVTESQTGGSITTGFVTGWRKFPFFNDTFMRFSANFNHIRYEHRPEAAFLGIPLPLNEIECATRVYQGLLDKLFSPGEYTLLSFQTGQDKKNHPIHPTRGHTWLARAELAVSPPDVISTCKLGYSKIDLDFNWYTPIIDEYNLIFHLHGYAGAVTPFKDRLVPYRELYHIGGPASVRGYIYGQIGPQFSAYPGIYDSIGGSKALFVNAELLFPITPDYNMSGVVFYDGGAGWDNPYANTIPSSYLHNNTFDYRHAVGFGLRIMNPMPIKVDWGFKLDPRPGENAYEVHFGMNYDW